MGGAAFRIVPPKYSSSGYRLLGLEVSKDPAQLLLHAVNGVKERSRDQSFIWRQQSLQWRPAGSGSEHLVFKIIQRARLTRQKSAT